MLHMDEKKLGDLFDSKLLPEAVQDVPVFLKGAPQTQARSDVTGVPRAFATGSYSPERNSIQADLAFLVNQDEAGNRTLAPEMLDKFQTGTNLNAVLHEATHAAQNSLGLLNGSSVDLAQQITPANRTLEELYDKYGVPFVDLMGGYSPYFRNIGEAQARTVPHLLLGEEPMNKFWDAMLVKEGMTPEQLLMNSVDLRNPERSRFKLLDKVLERQDNWLKNYVADRKSR